jgi:hypothetical protein
VEAEGVVDELLAAPLASVAEGGFALSAAPGAGVVSPLDDAAFALEDVEAKLGSRLGSTVDRESCERIIASSLASLAAFWAATAASATLRILSTEGVFCIECTCGVSPLGVGEILRASTNVVEEDATVLSTLPPLLFVSMFVRISTVDSFDGSEGSGAAVCWDVDVGLPLVPAAAFAVARDFRVVLLGLVLGVSIDCVPASMSTSVEAAACKLE